MVLFILVMLAALGFPTAGFATPAQGPPGTVTTASDSITYFTRDGDTLSSIAQQFTERRGSWTELARLNNIQRDARIPVGTPILIPARLLSDDLADGRIVAFFGDVALTNAEGHDVPVITGAPVREGARVQTGKNSFLTIALADDSRLSLPSNSHVKLSRLRLTRHTKSPRTEITLLKGRAESRVAPLRHKGGTYDVRTPLSVAGVRGTHFRVGLGAGAVMTEVVSGTVDVTPAGSMRSVRLHSGMGHIVNADGRSNATDLPAAPALQQLSPLPAESAVALAMHPQQGTAAFHVQIARDSDAQNIVSEAYTAGNRIRIKGLAQGDYYARVSAISLEGLESGAQMHAFRLDKRSESVAVSDDRVAPNPPQPPRIELSSDGRLLVKWPDTPASTYHVQVARDPAFSWLLVSKPATESQLLVARPPFGTYYARVKAIGRNGAASAFSLAQGFVVTDHWVLHEGKPKRVDAPNPKAER